MPSDHEKCSNLALQHDNENDIVVRRKINEFIEIGSIFKLIYKLFNQINTFRAQKINNLIGSWTTAMARSFFTQRFYSLQ